MKHQRVLVINLALASLLLTSCASTGGGSSSGGGLTDEDYKRMGIIEMWGDQAEAALEPMMAHPKEPLPKPATKQGIMAHPPEPLPEPALQ